MKPIDVKKIVEVVDGELLCGDEKNQVTSVVTDSREAKAGTLFVPVIGERVDAHKFIGNVFSQGAVASFTSKREIVLGGACIYVEDTVKALQAFATYYRSLFSLPVIGVTGSVGKTTTKEMLACVLETKYKVLKTFGNANSQIGVSLMMFHLEDSTELAIFEMGISEPGEMDRLVNIAKPEVAVMTNIGVSHIGNLGSRENICHEKGKIISHFSEEGAIYICGNGDLIELSKSNIPWDMCNGTCKRIYYGTEDNLDCMGRNITIQDGKQSFEYVSKDQKEHITLAVLGIHNVNNAIVALCLGERYGVSMDKAKAALLAYQPIKMRGEQKDVGGIHIIDDTYNASPDSIDSGIDALFDYSIEGKKVAVLADVLELGERSRELHEGIGEYIVEEQKKGKKLSGLITYGKEASYISDVVMKKTDILVKECNSHEEVIEALDEIACKGDWILIKGSRGMQMDLVVKQLMDRG